MVDERRFIEWEKGGYRMDPIVIVGGGVVGTTLAYYLRDAPTDVILVEKDHLGAGSTGDSMSIFAWHLNLDGIYTDICKRAWEAYQQPLADGFLNFHEGGFLAVADRDEYLAELESEIDAYDQPGVTADAEVISPAETAAYGLDPAGVGAGAVFIQEGRFTDDPGYKIVTYFSDRAAHAGVEIQERVRVTDVATERGQVTGVQTSAGFIDAGTVVNAAGPWSTKLNAMAGVDLPIKHTPAPMIQYELDHEFGPAGVPLSLVTFEDGLYFVGGYPRTVYAGNAPHEGAESGFEDAYDYDADVVFDSRLSHEFRAVVADRVDATVPLLETASVVDEWKCLRTITPDHFPLVGETAVDGYHVATGLSGQGITIGPAVGELLADHILTGDIPDELEVLAPDRFE